MTDRPLGRVQRYVLVTLGDGVARSGTDWAAWYPLDTEQARGAIERLGLRGLVDVAGFKGRSRTYKLTAKGYEVFNQLEAEPDTEEDNA